MRAFFSPPVPLEISGTRATEFAEEKYVFFSADPGGIGSAFHRAEEGRKEKLIYVLVIRKNHSRTIKSINSNKIVMLP